MSGARSAALWALKKWRQNAAWSDAALDTAIRRYQLVVRDAALCSRICYGTLQNLALLDHVIAQCCDRPLDKLQPQVLDILRISAYQILFLDRIPAHAAVSEAVELCKNSGVSRASGLVNAVLRRITSLNGDIPNLPNEGTAEFLSVRYSHPLWLCKAWIDAHGYAFTEQLLAANNAPASACLQCNQLRVDASRLYADLRDAGFPVTMHPNLPDAIMCSVGDLASSKQYLDGWFYVQDAAAKTAVLIADPQPGMRVMDACAAPGGKSFAAAIQMRDTGEIISCDIHKNKLKRIQDGADRLGIQCIKTLEMDAKHPTFDAASFDVVLADVPCSGLGVIRKKPEIRYKDPDALGALPQIQKDILRGLARMVKPGGLLVYSTCTVQEAENEDVIHTFLDQNPDYALEPIQLPWLIAPEGMYTFWPHIDDTDGFFVAKMRKRV